MVMQYNGAIIAHLSCGSLACKMGIYVRAWLCKIAPIRPRKNTFWGKVQYKLPLSRQI